MGELKRIDVALVPAMFQRHKVKPTQRVWYGNESTGKEGRCGCIVAALVIDGAAKDCRMDLIKVLRLDAASCTSAVSAATGLDAQYLMGLALGWDGVVPWCAFGDAKAAGHADGKAAWEACKHLAAKGA